MDLYHERGEGLCHEGQVVGQGEVEQDPQGPSVDARGRVAAGAELLGSHVAGRPDHGPGLGQALDRVAERDPEVSDLELTRGVDEEVLGLEVAVHDPLSVGVLEAAGDLGQEANSLAELRAPGLVEGPSSLDELVDQGQAPADLEDLVDAEHVGVIEGG